MDSYKKSGAFIIMLIFAILLASSLVSSGFSEWYKSITGEATTSSVTINVTIANTAPKVIIVSNITSQSPTENGVTSIVVNFTVNDTDGFGNIKNSSALVNLSFAGEPLRQNSTCIRIVDYAVTNANFSCTIGLQYFDASASWNITAAINDTANSIAYNTSMTFAYTQLSAFVSSPGSLTFASLSPAAINQTATNDPILLNNTGNKAITAGNLQVNSTNLVGEIDSTKAIYAANISVGVNTVGNAECDTSPGANNASLMQRFVFQAINQSVLPVYNHTFNNGSSGQEQFYFCIRLVGAELTGQAYSTLSESAWTVKIV